jgi:hypothetical protein
MDYFLCGNGLGFGVSGVQEFEEELIANYELNRRAAEDTRVLAVRLYKPQDYESVISLYKQSELYGGQFDENRDSQQRLDSIIQNDPEAILVYEHENQVIGTISIIEDTRVAWLFRFAVMKGDFEQQCSKALYDAATKILYDRGHTQILVYTPEGDERLKNRYQELGMNEGGTYTCFWVDLN